MRGAIFCCWPCCVLLEQYILQIRCSVRLRNGLDIKARLTFACFAADICAATILPALVHSNKVQF